MTVITYRHRPKSQPKRETSQPVRITGSVIVDARRPKKYQTKAGPLVDDLEADERVRQFFVRMGLGAAYAKEYGAD